MSASGCLGVSVKFPGARADGLPIAQCKCFDVRSSMVVVQLDNCATTPPQLRLPPDFASIYS